ncbi:MAG: GTP 3',8-cyclase MoaA [Phycisphaerales bacterium]|nr:GTP 3',8-cyclase MoaA [Phycisphaerales bacterium]
MQPQPTDRFGRRIHYLRVSLTDHCNLRCIYCMPVRGLTFVPHDELLNASEIETVVRAAVAIGFDKVRLTGGEPTMRTDLVEIVRRVAAVDGVRDLSMTTNAILLPGIIHDLVAAGLKRVNVHVDTLNPDHLKRVMRFGSIAEIWAGIESAVAAGLSPLKLNCVVVRDYNDADVVDLARLTIDREWHVRFIELMPLGTDECARVAMANFVPSSETRARIRAALGDLTPLPNLDHADESRNFRLPGARGVVGFISPVSEPYCGTCNRMRLTADGKLHLCLLHDTELDLKPALRNGNGHTLDAVQSVLLRGIQRKPTGHRLDEGVHTENRRMFQLGG